MSASTLTAAKPLLPQPDAEVDKNDPKVQSAVAFVKDSRVRLTPNETKIRFLKEKGLSPSQIKYAFDQAGQSVALEKIVEVQTQPVSTSSEAPRQALTSRPNSPSRLPTLRANSASTRQTHTLYPAAPFEPEEPPRSSWDWRDVVIGIGAASLAAIGGAKLFQRYSPYELRRKDDKTQAALRGAGRRQQQLHRTGVFSSDTETDRGLRISPNGAVASPPPPLPQAPASPPAPDKDEEVKRLEKELADAKEALANERKRSADLAVSVGRIRAEKQQLVHKNDKLSQKIDELEEKLKKLEDEKKKPEDEVENKEGGEDEDTEVDEFGMPQTFGEDAGEKMPPEIESLLPKPETATTETAAPNAAKDAAAPAEVDYSAEGDEQPEKPSVAEVAPTPAVTEAAPTPDTAASTATASAGTVTTAPNAPAAPPAVPETSVASASDKPSALPKSASS